MVNQAPDPSSLGRTCSASCAKSGIAAPLLSIVALALLPNLQQIGAVRALSNHALARINLKTAVDDLEATPCWQLLKSVEPDIEKRTIAEVRNRTCYREGESRKLVPQYPEPPMVKELPRRLPVPLSDHLRSTLRPPKPGQVSNVRMLFTPDNFGQIEEALSLLGQRETLDATRSLYKYRLAVAIQRWERRAWQLSVERITEKDLAYEQNPKNYDLHKYLTVGDIVFLADFDFNDEMLEQTFTESSQFVFPSAATPIRLSSAAGLVEFGLLLCVAYFLLFQIEARFSPTFPDDGTLFAVFHRTRPSRILFLLLASVPASCAILVANSADVGKALDWTLGIVTVMVCAGIANTAPRSADRRAAIEREKQGAQ